MTYPGCSPSPRAVVERTVDAWRATGHTAAPGVAVTDSVKAVEAGGTLRNVDRASLVAVQSPAVVPLRVLRRALATAWPTHSLVHALQSLGEQVVMVEGSHAGEPILDELSQLRAEITLSER